MSKPYDLIVIGAGSAGLTAAEFGARLGARVALVEKNKVGGDCTWYGCVPSKALLHVANQLHQARQAAQFGLQLAPDRQVDMVAVRRYIDDAIQQIYQWESPAQLQKAGVEVFLGSAEFVDAHTVQVAGRQLKGKHFLIASGASPDIPPIPGLEQVNFQTNHTIFANERLPQHLIVLGAGAVGLELAQAYRRLGAQVTLIDVALLPDGDPDMARILAAVFAQEGVRFIAGLVDQISPLADDELIVSVGERQIKGDMLLLATGRQPVVTGLALDKAGISFDNQGIAVNQHLQSSVPHIYAAGDCLGQAQFTHLAGWQGFQATRNALLPGRDSGFTRVLPWAIFTAPELAQVGLNEGEARAQWGTAFKLLRRELDRVDRAVTDADLKGFIKVIIHDDKIVGATIVAARAGEMITEFAVAMKHGLSVRDLAGTLHVYPSYAMGLQRLLADEATEMFLQSSSGRWLRRFKGYR